MQLVVMNDSCPANHKCPAVSVCPVNALSQAGVAAPTVDSATCIACGKCAAVCPMGALRMADG